MKTSQLFFKVFLMLLLVLPLSLADTTYTDISGLSYGSSQSASAHLGFIFQTFDNSSLCTGGITLNKIQTYPGTTQTDCHLWTGDGG